LTTTLKPYLRYVFLFTLGLALVILLLGIIDGLFSSALLFVIFALGTIVAGVVALVYLMLFGQGVLLALRHDMPWKSKILAVVISPLLLSALIFTGFPILRAGSHIGIYGKLLRNHSAYEQIIAQNNVPIDNGPLQERRTENGIEYEIDSGPPLRFAFEPNGILDNWSGIVYDPSGDVMLADGFDSNGKFRAPERITKLFGGDLVFCSHLFGHYYKCGFT
jgi:hypothetical protein